MTTIIICLIIVALAIALFYFYTSKTEHFYASSCEELNSKNGLVCSIPNSPLYSNKCYQVRQSAEHPDGEHEHVNVNDCTQYPLCREIGESCKADNIARLDNGYVERW